jgi:hypothetical protein
MAAFHQAASIYLREAPSAIGLLETAGGMVKLGGASDAETALRALLDDTALPTDACPSARVPTWVIPVLDSIEDIQSTGTIHRLLKEVESSAHLSDQRDLSGEMSREPIACLSLKSIQAQRRKV